MLFSYRIGATTRLVSNYRQLQVISTWMWSFSIAGWLVLSLNRTSSCFTLREHGLIDCGTPLVIRAGPSSQVTFNLSDVLPSDRPNINTFPQSQQIIFQTWRYVLLLLPASDRATYSYLLETVGDLFTAWRKHTSVTVPVPLSLQVPEALSFCSVLLDSTVTNFGLIQVHSHTLSSSTNGRATCRAFNKANI